MNRERIFSVLLAPHVSEKATNCADKNKQIVFKVAKDATKKEIREAIEVLWSVKVSSVQTLLVKGKKKRQGRFEGVRSDWKKAYVSLREGFDIDFLGSE